MGKLARLVYKQGFLHHKKASSFLEIVSIIKDNTNLFIRIQQIEVSLIKRTADAAVKGRSSGSSCESAPSIEISSLSGSSCESDPSIEISSLSGSSSESDPSIKISSLSDSSSESDPSVKNS
ncbi:hypothetical protein SO802_014161 [Lithocarpus litseifolius]|uniref:Uncharacterized protein n=1 Tax=Lithocarpus litseifolius TaxID=425828 RepID=A0AAW2CT63_9ROSI